MFIGNKWKMAHTMVCPAITLSSHIQGHQPSTCNVLSLEGSSTFYRYAAGLKVMSCKHGDA